MLCDWPMLVSCRDAIASKKERNSLYSQEHKFIFTSQVLKRMFISRHKWVTGILLLLVLLIIYRVSLFFSRKIRFEAAQSTDMTDTLHTRAQYQVIDINLHTCINMGLLTIWSIIPSSHCSFALRIKLIKIDIQVVPTK